METQGIDFYASHKFVLFGRDFLLVLRIFGGGRKA